LPICYEVYEKSKEIIKIIEYLKLLKEGLEFYEQANEITT